MCLNIIKEQVKRGANCDLFYGIKLMEQVGKVYKSAYRQGSYTKGKWYQATPADILLYSCGFHVYRQVKGLPTDYDLVRVWVRGRGILAKGFDRGCRVWVANQMQILGPVPITTTKELVAYEND